MSGCDCTWCTNACGPRQPIISGKKLVYHSQVPLKSRCEVVLHDNNVAQAYRLMVVAAFRLEFPQ
ncbi:hypothetical protein DPMN_064647 [Dreissena polymorpha]|uniref:Uncharacterized protein n=1 Tax=Dreissena polymorpha TaxID=45954 RepID=A0A9D4HL81_DREPO|nr:hypothetical protein DPMN_064647 [Dreissena polymorpha]